MENLLTRLTICEGIGSEVAATAGRVAGRRNRFDERVRPVGKQTAETQERMQRFVVKTFNFFNRLIYHTPYGENECTI